MLYVKELLNGLTRAVDILVDWLSKKLLAKKCLITLRDSNRIWFGHIGEIVNRID